MDCQPIGITMPQIFTELAWQIRIFVRDFKHHVQNFVQT